jgi:integrase
MGRATGMALVERIDKAGKRRWQVRIAVRDDSGKRQNRTIGTYGTKAEARKAERDALTQQERGTLLKPDATTVAELLNEYLRVEVPRTVRPENRQPYESIIRNHLKPTLGPLLARKLTVEHVEKLLADMQERGLSSSLVSKTRMRLSSALKLGMRWGIVGTNVADVAKPPTITYRKSAIWTPTQVATFLEHASRDDLWPLWLLMVETGARTSELLGLAWDDVNLDGGTLRIGRQVIRLLKGTPTVKDGGKSQAASRSIRLTPGTVTELRNYRTRWLKRQLAASAWSGDFLFCTRDGSPLSANNLRKVYDRLVTAAGVPPITPHAIRKTAITLALANGASPKAVAMRVGHADSRVTLDVYSSITSDMDDALLDIVTAIVPKRTVAGSA